VGCAAKGIGAFDDLMVLEGPGERYCSEVGTDYGSGLSAQSGGRSLRIPFDKRNALGGLWTVRQAPTSGTCDSEFIAAFAGPEVGAW
jgi:hypothetical protein